MTEKNNAYCSICGNPYYVCMSCLDSMRLSPWKIHTDTSEHFKIYQIIHGYTSNVYNKDEARTKLKNVNLDDMEAFKPHIKQIIEDILKEDKPIVKATKKVEPIIEVEPVVEEIAKVVNEKVEDVIEIEKAENIEKPIISRKRSYKVEVE